jgi:hypothetical protein
VVFWTTPVSVTPWAGAEAARAAATRVGNMAGSPSTTRGLNLTHRLRERKYEWCRLQAQSGDGSMSASETAWPLLISTAERGMTNRNGVRGPRNKEASYQRKPLRPLASSGGSSGVSSAAAASSWRWVAGEKRVRLTHPFILDDKLACRPHADDSRPESAYVTQARGLLPQEAIVWLSRPGAVVCATAGREVRSAVRHSNFQGHGPTPLREPEPEDAHPQPSGPSISRSVGVRLTIVRP